MDIDITGGRIFYTFPIDFPVLGKFQINPNNRELATASAAYKSPLITTPERMLPK